ncbi:MAG: hypothetical protein ACK5HP_01700 [Bacilli bacterium]
MNIDFKNDDASNRKENDYINSKIIIDIIDDNVKNINDSSKYYLVHILHKKIHSPFIVGIFTNPENEKKCYSQIDECDQTIISDLNSTIENGITYRLNNLKNLLKNNEIKIMSVEMFESNTINEIINISKNNKNTLIKKRKNNS